jgi:pSer/pThr/pTyr-binding forkhead associated (FHA) protein
MKCEKCGFAANPDAAITCRLCGKPLAASREALPRGRRGASTKLKRRKRHLLLRTGAPALGLERGTRMSFGRSPSCDLSIPSQRVSRMHAEITWDGDQPILRDLGSENGTLVNGRPIREHPLADRDELAIGPYLCTFRSVSGKGSLKEALTLADSKSDTQEMDLAALSGRLDSISLFEILKALEFNEKTGTLEIFETGHADGRLIIRAGVPIYAAIGDLSGERAVFSLLSHEDGSFRFTAEAEEVEPNLDQSISELLLDAQRKMDSRHTMPRRLADLGDLEF